MAHPVGFISLTILNALTMFFQTEFVVISSNLSIFTNNILLLSLFLYLQREHIIARSVLYMVRSIAILVYLWQDFYLFFIFCTFFLFSPLSPLSTLIHQLILPSPLNSLFSIQSNLGLGSNYGQSDDIISNQLSTNKKSGIFDLSHAVINMDPYSQLYGNLGLWEKIPDIDLFGKNDNNCKNEKIVHFQKNFDQIENYLLFLQHSLQIVVPPTISPDQTYFIAARRFSLMVYYHADVIPTQFFAQSVGNELKKNQNKENNNANKISLLDVGCGSGDQLYTLIDLWMGFSADNDKNDKNDKNEKNYQNNQINHTNFQITGVNYSFLQTKVASERALLRYPNHVHNIDNDKDQYTLLDAKLYKNNPNFDQHSQKITQKIDQNQTRLTPTPICSLKFLHGSGTELLSTLRLKPQSFTAITAIDCVYHFFKKYNFYKDSFALLQSSGSLVCTDLILKDDIGCEQCTQYISQYTCEGDDFREFSGGSRGLDINDPQNDSKIHKFDKFPKINNKSSFDMIKTCLINHCHLSWTLPHLMPKFSIPKENLWTRKQYIDYFEQIGFINVQFIDLENLIFSQFGQFLDKFVPTFPQNLINFNQWIKFFVTGYALKNWAPHVFHYALIMANKPPEFDTLYPPSA